MKYILSEVQYNKIIKTLNESKITPTDIKTLESILNKQLPKKFPFFVKIDLKNVELAKFAIGPISGDLVGTFYFKLDWFLDYWMKFFHNMGKSIELSKLEEILSDLPSDELLGEDNSKQFETNIRSYANFVLQSSLHTTINKLYIDHTEHIFVDKDEPIKMEQMESELTEKCWAGYTQKGMKTMFGKRYPNCVKKTKK